MNRRDALRSLGLGATAALIPAGVILAAPVSTELADLIERHRAAHQVWVDAVTAMYETEKGTPAYAAAMSQEGIVLQHENTAMGLLLAYRPASLEEVHTKLAYLTEQDGPWEGVVPEGWELELLFGSLMPEVRS